MATRTSKSARPFRWTFRSPDALQAWGRAFAALLQRGDVVALMGPLGAGKTTLVQGIAEGRGYKRGANSPTFALANEYGTKKGNVYHMDMYRLTEPELRAFPLEEYWQDGLCLIEWADRVRDRWPEDTLAIELRAPNPDTRTLTIQKPSPRWRTRLQALPAQ